MPLSEIAKKVNLSEQDAQRFALRAASQAIRKAYGIEGERPRREAPAATPKAEPGTGK